MKLLSAKRMVIKINQKYSPELLRSSLEMTLYDMKNSETFEMIVISKKSY